MALQQEVDELSDKIDELIKQKRIKIWEMNSLKKELVSIVTVLILMFLLFLAGFKQQIITSSKEDEEQLSEK